MFNSNVSVLFEDKYLLALNKPHGLICESDNALHDSLQARALAYVRSVEKHPQKCFIGLPHRLDKPVSGVVLFAKKKSILKLLTEMFAERQIEKIYWVLTDTTNSTEKGILQNWLQKDNTARKAIISTTQMPHTTAVSLEYALQKTMTDRTLWQVKLITGKYHQIRAQFAFAGMPIVGDSLYGSKAVYKPNAICLHARELKFVHPVTNETIQIIAPLPEDDEWQQFN